MELGYTKAILLKQKEIVKYRFTYISAPWGSGKTEAIKYFFRTHDDLNRVFIDCRKINSLVFIKKNINKISKMKKVKYIVIDHMTSEVEKMLSTYMQKNEVPDNVRIIMIHDQTFAAPQHYAYKLQDQILFITYEYFRYQVSDIERLLQENQIMMSSTDIATLYECSDGYKLILKEMIAHYLIFCNLHCELALLYAMHESLQLHVLRGTPNLFIQLSYCESFSLSYINDLSNFKQAITSILQMADTRFFIRERKANMFTLHPTFISYLRYFFPLSKKRQKDIHLRLAAWNMKHHFIFNALYHYYKGRDFVHVIDLINTYTEENYIDEYTQLLKNVYEDCPLSLLKKNPYCFLKIISDTLMTVDPKPALEKLEVFKQTFALGDGHVENNLLAGEVMIIEAFYYFGHIHQMNRCFKEAYHLFHGQSSRIANPALVTTLGSPHILYLYYHTKETLLDIYQTMRLDFHYYLDITRNNAIGMDILAEAEYHFERLHVQKAKILAEESLQISRLYRQDAISIASLFLLGRIAFHEHDKESFRSCIRFLQKQYANKMLEYQATMASAYLHVLAKDISEVQNFLNGSNSLFYDIPKYSYIVQGLAYLFLQDPIKARAIGHVLIQIYREQDYIFAAMYGYLLLCATCDPNFYYEEGISYMSKLIELCEKEQLVAFFVEFYDYIFTYLILLGKLPKHTTFEQRLLDTTEEFAILCEGIQLLSQKEQEVYYYLCKGYSRLKISELLNVSLNTTKYHIRNIYQKLQVKNNEELINRDKITI